MALELPEVVCGGRFLRFEAGVYYRRINEYGSNTLPPQEGVQVVAYDLMTGKRAAVFPGRKAKTPCWKERFWGEELELPGMSWEDVVAGKLKEMERVAEGLNRRYGVVERLAA